MPKAGTATSLIRTIGTGSFWLSSSSLVVRFIGLATTVIVLTHLTVREYGIVELILAVVAFMSIFFLPGLFQIVVSDMGIEKGNGRTGEARNLLHQFFFYQAVSAVVAWAILFFGSNLLTLYFSGLAGDLVRIVSFIFLVYPLRMTMQALLQVETRFGLLAIHQTLIAVSKLVLVLVLLLWLGMGVVGVLFSHVLMEVIALVVVFPFALSTYRTFHGAYNAHGSKQLWRILLAHGKWAVLGSYVNDANQSFRLWVIKLLLGTEAVGLFAAAQGMLQQVRSILPLQRILGSIIPQHTTESDTFSKLVVKGVKYNVLGNVALGLVAALAVPILIILLLPHYMPSIVLFEVMLLSLIPTSVGGILSVVFYALQKQRNLFWANILRLAVTMFVLPVAVLWFGLIGGAMELTISATVFALERLRRVKVELPGMVFPWHSLLQYDLLDARILQAIRSFWARGHRAQKQHTVG